MHCVVSIPVVSTSRIKQSPLLEISSAWISTESQTISGIFARAPGIEYRAGNGFNAKQIAHSHSPGRRMAYGQMKAPHCEHRATSFA